MTDIRPVSFMKAKLTLIIITLFIFSCNNCKERTIPSFRLVPAVKVYFKSFVDCNIAEAWIGDPRSTQEWTRV